jgi:hypothetical protein
VKFQTATGFDDFRPMARLGFKKGILVSKDRLDNRDGWIILPLEMFHLFARTLKSL